MKLFFKSIQTEFLRSSKFVNVAISSCDVSAYVAIFHSEGAVGILIPSVRQLNKVYLNNIKRCQVTSETIHTQKYRTHPR